MYTVYLETLKNRSGGDKILNVGAAVFRSYRGAYFRLIDQNELVSRVTAIRFLPNIKATFNFTNYVLKCRTEGNQNSGHRCS